LSRPARLDDEALREALCSLPEWRLDEGKLRRDFRFEDFSQAFAFMTRCALVAERLDHHPEWFNVYDRVRVHLVTHDAGGISELDVELARAMDRFAKPRARAKAG